MDIKTFLNSDDNLPLQEYPIEETIIAIEKVSDGDNFLDDIAKDLEGAMDMAIRYKVMTVAIERGALCLQEIVSNVMAFNTEKHTEDGKLRTVSNILNSARELHRLARDIRHAVYKVIKK